MAAAASSASAAPSVTQWTAQEKSTASLLRLLYRRWKDVEAVLKQDPQHAALKQTSDFVHAAWKDGTIDEPGTFVSQLLRLGRSSASLQALVKRLIEAQSSRLDALIHSVDPHICSLEEKGEAWTPIDAWQTDAILLQHRQAHPGAVVWPQQGGDITPQLLFDPVLVSRECGAGGDCQFKSIAFAMNKAFEVPIDARDLRQLAAAQVTPENIGLIRSIVFDDDDQQEFLSRRSSKKLLKTHKNMSDMEMITLIQQRISTRGKGFQGDATTLALLAKSRHAVLLDTGFLVLMQGEFDQPPRLINPCVDGHVYQNYVFLYRMTHDEQGDAIEHYQLAGMVRRDGSVQCAWTRHELAQPDCALGLLLRRDLPRHPLVCPAEVAEDGAASSGSSASVAQADSFMEDVPAPAAAAASSSRGAASAAQWACAHCTFINEAPAQQCAMCALPCA